MRKRVLVVDDDENVRALVADLCVEAGHVAVPTGNGREAWLLLDGGEQFDLIISDNNMPKMTGVELLRRVRADRRMAHLPFILMSGDVDQTPLEMACAALGATFVQKSFSILTLLDLLGVGVEMND